MDSRYDYKPLFSLTLHNRTLQLTREGGGFVALVFGVGLVAINTGNNLLYLVLAMCCSFIAVSGVLSELTLKEISVSGTLPKTIYANEPYPLVLRAVNGKKKIPSYSLHLSFPDDKNLGFQAERGLYLFYVPAGSSAEKTVMIKARKRGPLTIRDCRLATSFPFGFFVKSRKLDIDVRALVFPPLREVELPTPARDSLEGEGVVKPRGDELHSLRDFRPGDSLSSVHWKASAKTGSLRVKEFTSSGRQSYVISLNIHDPQTNAIVPSDLLEKRVSEAASLAYRLVRQGDEVSLKTHEIETGPGNSEAHLEEILSYLAVVGLNANGLGSPGDSASRAPS
ncbi:MAG: DUF58 domain-containing protein [Nitrospinae bacterium]|nr:DUF58 domain-containing protein [Nitrospinota bacterium]